jgi:UDPglucose--hexose-1-phosphate uridylyltransferase
VVCYSPKHNRGLGELTTGEVRRVIDTWADQTMELGAIGWINHVQIFENRGAAMGASNSHPHGQIWAQQHLPVEPLKELNQQRACQGRCLLCDYVELELGLNERVVFETGAFLVLVPYWATWPFETLVVPRRHSAALGDLSAAQRDGLAAVLRELTLRYDNLFGVSFPYSMGWHQRPTDGDAHSEWHLHAHFYPPLLRSATVRKFMVGYELLCEPQRDLTPEQGAQRLREVAPR